jgi:hypothetical protein
MKYVKRILGLPFFLILNIIGMLFHLCLISKYFILYGGEAMAYDKKNTPKMIADIYYQLEKQNCICNDIEKHAPGGHCKSCH